MPRFVRKNGSLNPARNWATGDKMVDTDLNNISYTLGAESIVERDRSIPLNGVRVSMEVPALETLCLSANNEEIVNFVLPGYGICALQFSNRQFEESINSDPDSSTGYKMINLNVNHPQ